VSHYVYETYLYKYVKRTTCTVIICVVGFIVGLPFITNGGFYLFELVDNYATLISCFVTLAIEAFIVSRYIGIDVLKEIVANKTGKIIPEYVFTSVKYFCPVVLSVLTLISLKKAVIIQSRNNIIRFIQKFTLMPIGLIGFNGFLS
jgi:SNF family Na+-dependent transporter